MNENTEVYPVVPAEAPHTSLAKLDGAVKALAEASTLEEVKHIADIAEAARTYAKAAKLGLEAQNKAAEIHIRAQRKAGEMLSVMEKNPGSKNLGGSSVEPPKDQRGTDPPRLADLGITKQDSHRWQKIASLPEAQFESFISESKDRNQELTTHAAIKLARIEERKNHPRRRRPIPNGQFDLIYADPPWEYQHARTESRAVENHYPTMSLDEIKTLKIPAADDAVLFLWTTAPKLEESITVIHSWEFTYRTCAVWDKEVFGMGYWFRIQHELLLVGTRGNFHPPDEDKRVSSVFRYKRSRHSAKPKEIRDLLADLYPDAKKLELFARDETDGWETWGNE